jgi:endonuclease/exonuclease/phosphatase family metal-dependent hydrolase
MFWLPYFLPSALLALLAWFAAKAAPLPEQAPSDTLSRGWAALLAAVFLVTLVCALPSPRVLPDREGSSALVVMTFNIQQANDRSAEQSYDRQLALIRKISPDILALQESDSARVSLNNNDYVRYYAEKLGYYSYYGPSTITGTFGTAILSRYPLLNTRTVFSYSDTDEIGTAEAEIDYYGRVFSIYDVHPDGSDTAKLAFARTLLERSKDKPNVIALGDYNLPDDQPAYQLISAVYSEAWTSVYPSGIGADGTDMSGAQRIDHIFVSPSLKVRNAVYVLPPASASDHPAHWAVIYWEGP